MDSIGMKGYQYILSAFFIPLGAFGFLLVLIIVMWGSFYLMDSMTHDPETAGNIAALLTSFAAATLLIVMISLGLKKSTRVPGTACWFPLIGIFTYHLFSALLWWFVYGLDDLPPQVYMAFILIYEGGGTIVNIIGLDVLALVITFLAGFLIVLFGPYSIAGLLSVS